MVTGKGELVIRGGRRLSLSYEIGSAIGDQRSGYLIGDVSTIDPGVFCEKLQLHCDDGTWIELAVTQFSDRHIAFVGKVLSAAA